MKLVQRNCGEVPGSVLKVEEYAKVVELVLGDIDWGFFVVCSSSGSSDLMGFMYFSYEWSDWRNGLFYWLQTASAPSDEVYTAMVTYVNEYGKTHNCIGFRLQSEKEFNEYWKPFVQKLELEKTHYYLYHIDTV